MFVYQTGQEVKMGTPTEILIASVEAFADAAYRHSISLKTLEALHTKAKLGHAVNSPPYAYPVDRRARDAQGEVVREAAPEADAGRDH